MAALRSLQGDFCEALLSGDSTRVAEEIAGDGLSPEARLRIYRHHVFTTLTAALGATYPVTCRLVDRRFFAYAADGYIRANPPAGPCLFEYGAAFPDFLAEFPACADQRFLPDVARLEWAMNAALHAEDAHPFNAERLAAVPPGDVPRLVFRFDPSVSLLASPWPVDQVWRAHQDAAMVEAPVDLGAAGALLEVRRLDGDVVMRRLHPAEHALRHALWRGGTLEAAARAAIDRDAAFDLASGLRDLLDERILVDFAVSK